MERSILNDIFGTKPRKKSINSKVKGNANERIVCKVLAAWTGAEFVRVPQSGGLRWKNTENICGDVICTDKEVEFMFTVETKHLKRIEMEGSQGRLRKNSMVATVWEQATRDADRAMPKKLPMMMLRENDMPAGEYMVFIDIELAEMFKRKFQLIPNVWFYNDETGIAGYDSSRFFATSYTQVLKEIKRLLNKGK